MNAAEAIFNTLKQYTDTVFLVPGGGAMFLVDALGRSGLRYVPMLHEQGAGYAAVGYAMQSGKLGVCLVTSGPGATNALTPCAAAWMDSVPVLFISGQANSWTLIGKSRLRTRGVQEVDIIPMVESITKYAYQYKSGKFLAYDIDKAVGLAMKKRPGPCWLDVPLDVQSEEI